MLLLLVGYILGVGILIVVKDNLWLLLLDVVLHDGGISVKGFFVVDVAIGID